MFWLNLILILVWTVIGFILMLLPGWFAKLCAMPFFIFCLPLIAVSKQTFIAEGGALFTESFGTIFVGSWFTLWIILSYLALANVFDEVGRDYLGRNLGQRTVA
jgi:hypothetical protein